MFDYRYRTAVGGRRTAANEHLELIGQYWYWMPQLRKVLPSTQYHPVLANIAIPNTPMLVSF